MKRTFVALGQEGILWARYSNTKSFYRKGKPFKISEKEVWPYQNQASSHRKVNHLAKRMLQARALVRQLQLWSKWEIRRALGKGRADESPYKGKNGMYTKCYRQRLYSHTPKSENNEKLEIIQILGLDH